MPYWRLSSVYFFYFAVVGAISPFWGLYLENLEFSPADIGLLSAIPMVTKIAAPNIWGFLADYSGRRLFVAQLGAVGACVFFVGVFFTRDLFWLAVYLTIFSFFWNAILAQFEVITLGHLRGQTEQYSRIRVWGSIGFMVAVVGLGVLFDYVSITHLPSVIFVCLVGIYLSSLALPAEPQRSSEYSQKDFFSVLRAPVIWWFFAVVTLLHVSHGVYYTFYSIYLSSLDYSRSFIGVMWAIGVVAEIVLFIKMPLLMRLFSFQQLLLFTLAITGLRWLLIGWLANKLVVLLLAQLIHAFSFGAAHALAIEFVRQHFGKVAQGQGQALYSAICFGGGNALGAYFSGMLWQSSPQQAFLLSFFSTLLGLVIAVYIGYRGKLGDGWGASKV